MKNKKYKFGVLEIGSVVFISVVVTAFLTSIIMYKSYNYKTNYENANNDKDLQNFIDIYATVLDKYYEDIDTKEMLESAIDGMMDYLDDAYSTYLNTEEAYMLQTQLDGEYEGIGIQITEGNEIVAVFDDSPASIAGIKEKDVIIKVDSEEVKDYEISEVASLIKSKEGEFSLTVLRDGKEKEFRLKLNSLYIPAISTEIFDEKSTKIGYIYISTFSSTVKEQVAKSLEKLENDGINSLIIDLRYNSGGYLSGAEGIASLFLKKDSIIYYLEDKSGTTAYKDKTSDYREYPIVVLINESSASASEILTGALKESYGAVLVGKTSYGKGKVQQTTDLSDGSMVKYTTAKWLMPNKECIDQVGIKPDYEVELEIDEKSKEVKDTQLEKAKDLLK